MLLTIDVGNSRIKVAVFEEDNLVELFVFEPQEALKKISEILNFFPKISKAIYSSVGKLDSKALKFVQNKVKTTIVNHNSLFPFINKYSTPNTLGIDRMVLSAGATLKFPNQNRLIIDVGTCVTYDFIDKNNYYFGGAISPGIKLRYNSLHNYTAKLPLLTISNPDNFIGDSTNNSIHSGVINGLCFEIDGFISQYYLKYQDLTVILTGGDADFLAKRLKSTIFANSNFLLESLNLLSIYTENND
ncbi:MAG TPA: type III pantothenate kinase [Flavobacterium sp.]|uniref:type III pantothenate kinase n=1 Tax=Flavobacterium sp. TaxID=239 RepID=UPI002B4B4F93|nr:type III pantothenate kinase [Flavobacterium sp.]HLO73907.1 type III pantothenate kinase [Flavobacterium sp.]